MFEGNRWENRNYVQIKSRKMKDKLIQLIPMSTTIDKSN